ncbi:MAG: hypothetical protein KIT69_07500 [Propionibacteriaceae bacterium]|nr:hypothetical protein [Actinomycetota bacterium]MCW5952087.1 hypothetical protein [Propionibacteriaceae bacterium]
MLTHWSQKTTATVVAWTTAARRRALDERGALQSSELLGLIAITLTILAVLGGALAIYFARQQEAILR